MSRIGGEWSKRASKYGYKLPISTVSRVKLLSPSVILVTGSALSAPAKRSPAALSDGRLSDLVIPILTRRLLAAKRSACRRQ